MNRSSPKNKQENKKSLYFSTINHLKVFFV